MQVTSPPATQTIEVRDLDFAFAGGSVRTFTLRPGDSLTDMPEEFRLLQANGALTSIYKRHLLSLTSRTRTVTEELSVERKGA
jgi:hypothetical protein